ncbi:tetratricopeptide repeat protein [Deltaproteobacteria bacterium TL4]
MILNPSIDKANHNGSVLSKGGYGLLLLYFLSVTWLAYFNAIDAVPHIDDNDLFNNNIFPSKISTITPLKETLENLWSCKRFPCRPIVNLSFNLNEMINGSAVRGYHVFNISLHALNGFLVFLLIMKMGSHLYPLGLNTTENPLFFKSLFFSAFCASSLFVLHPALTACVNYIIQRYAEVATTFYLASVLSYLQSKEKPPLKKGFWIGMTLLLYWCAFRSKETAITLPGILLVYELFRIIQQPEKIRTLLRWAIPLFAGILLLCLIYYQTVMLKLEVFQNPHHVTFWQYFQTESRILVHYWKMLLLPLPQWISILYDFELSKSPFEINALMALSFHLSLMFTALGLARKGKYFCALGISWFYITLAPFWVIPLKTLMAGHKVYLAAQGVTFLLAEGFLWLGLKKFHYKDTIALCLMALAMLGTWTRNEVYQDPLTLLNDGIQKAPQHYGLYLNRGIYYLESKHFELALQDFDRALQLNPEAYKAYVNRGEVYFRLEQYPQAVQEYQKALSINPGYFVTYWKLAKIYTLFNQHQSALQMYDGLLEHYPESTPLLVKRGQTYAALGQHDKALSDYAQALITSPHLPMIYHYRGISLRHLKRYSEALADFSRLISQYPMTTEPFIERARTWVEMNQQDQALEDYTRAIHLDSRLKEVFIERGKIFWVKKQKDRACLDWKTACDLGECAFYHSAENKNTEISSDISCLKE